MLESKRATLKALDETGKGEALFAIWDTDDLDGDITRRGYYGDGVQEVFMVPHHLHASGQPPLGKGVIFEGKLGATYAFEMNTEFELGKAWLSHFRFDLSKGREPRQVWSYGFRLLPGGFTPLPGRKGRELHATGSGQPGCTVIEVSPVTQASQPLSRTLAAKDDGAPLSPRQRAWARDMYARHLQRQGVLQEIADLECQIGQETATILYQEFARREHVLQGHRY